MGIMVYSLLCNAGFISSTIGILTFNILLLGGSGDLVSEGSLYFKGLL